MVHEREIRQMLQAFPQHGHSRFTITTAGQKAAQAANPCTACRREGVSPAAWR